MAVLTIAATLTALVLAVGAAGYGERDLVDKAVSAVEHAFDESQQAPGDAKRELAAARNATLDGLDSVRDRLVDTRDDLERTLGEASTDARGGVADAIGAIERLLQELEELVRA